MQQQIELNTPYKIMSKIANINSKPKENYGNNENFYSNINKDLFFKNLIKHNNKNFIQMNYNSHINKADNCKY